MGHSPQFDSSTVSNNLPVAIPDRNTPKTGHRFSSVNQPANRPGRPRGPFSSRTLRAARKLTGENKSQQLDRIINALFGKACGETHMKDGSMRDVPRNASLDAIRMVHDLIDGPLPKVESQDGGGGGNQVVVIVENVGQQANTKV